MMEWMRREWMLCSSAMLLLSCMVLFGTTPAYSLDEIETVAVLWALFVCIAGLERLGVLRATASVLAGRLTPPKLVAAVFLLSLVVTNDGALVVIVPLALGSRVARKDILVVLLALAANTGACASPAGSPQNLFIFKRYELGLMDLTGCTAPFWISMLILLLASSCLLECEGGPGEEAQRTDRPGSSTSTRGWGFVLLLIATLLALTGRLPHWSVAAVGAAAWMLEPASLRVDYPLLLTFLCLFGVSDIIHARISPVIPRIEGDRDVFLASAVASQFMGNVPAAVFIADFTTRWRALLWGVSVGGFGSPISSFANLIAIRLYSEWSRDDTASFWALFLVFGAASFILGVLLFSLTYSSPATQTLLRPPFFAR